MFKKNFLPSTSKAASVRPQKICRKNSGIDNDKFLRWQSEEQKKNFNLIYAFWVFIGASVVLFTCHF